MTANGTASRGGGGLATGWAVGGRPPAPVAALTPVAIPKAPARGRGLQLDRGARVSCPS